jgi:hypothetical protein
MGADIRIGGISLDTRTAAVNSAARDWLETQARVAAYWRDVLVDRNGDLGLIEALDTHYAFLLAATR